uniref:hypothetical protein n=1 Tax=Clostridium sp. NkU-1 TaxID=1095009 RepID=UPI000AAD2AC6
MWEMWQKEKEADPLKKTVNLTEDDEKDIREMIQLGVSVTAQMLPNESDQSIVNML